MREKILAERGFDPGTSGLWAQHASTAPLCFDTLTCLTQCLIERLFWYKALFHCLLLHVVLKMLDLYLYILTIGHTSCNMLSIINKLALQKKLHNFVTNNVFLDKKSENTTTTKQNKIKHKTTCLSRALDPEPLAPKFDALPLHHGVNWE